MTRPTASPIAAGQEAETDRDRQGKLDDRCHPPRRDILHPRAEERMGRQVQLAGQGRVKIDAEPGVRPVVEQGFRIQQSCGSLPRTGHAQSCSHHWADMTWL